MGKSRTLQKNNWRYLSWSQLWLWENDPDRFVKQYIYGEQFEPNEYMILGKKVAECLENQNAGGDVMLEHLLMFMQPFQSHEHKISCEFEGVPLYMKLDGLDTDPLLILDEVKTGVKYSQSIADKNDQLTFYTIGILKKFGRLPDKIRLHWAQTNKVDGVLELTGHIETFPTTRTMIDIIKFTPRILRAWKEINAAANKEYKLAIK